MADGMSWDDLRPELEGPGVGIRRTDADGLAMCLIRLDAAIVLELAYYMRVGRDDELVAERRMEITATHQKAGTDTSAAGTADQRHRTRPFHSGAEPGYGL